MGGGKSPQGQPLKPGGKKFWEFFRGGEIFFPFHVLVACACMVRKFMKKPYCKNYFARKFC